MKKSLLLIALCLGLLNVQAQFENSSFTTTGRGGATTFVTDYQAVGINPANLGWKSQYEGKKITWGLAESSYSLYSEALSKQQLRDIIKSSINGDSTGFTRAEKIQAARDFTESGFAFNVDIGSFGFAFTHEKFGGIALRVNDHIQWNSTFSKTAADILFLGFNANYFDSLVLADASDTLTVANAEDYSNDTMSVLYGFANTPQLLSQVMNGSSMKMSWYREWNLSYGRKIVEVDSSFALYVGVGVKFYQGIGYVDVHSDGNGLEAFSALSPFFGIDYGTSAITNPSYIASNPGALPKPVGTGFGFDFGVNMTFFNKLKVGAAITNFGGSMKWDGNVYTASDTTLYDSKNGGLNNYNIFTQMDDILGKEGLFKWNGLATKTTKLPTAVRAGASLQIGEKIEIGTDVIIPMNDNAANFNKAMIGFGGDVKPLQWLRLQAGFVTGGNYGFQIPVGVTLVAKDGRYEAGVASRDAITFFSQNTPTLSLSTGFIRFRL